MTKLLIDECLSSELALMARERGHHEASHVVWIGKSGWKDWKLKEILFEEDWVLVTRDELDTDGDLTNQILEVTPEDDEAGIQIERYRYPDQ